MKFLSFSIVEWSLETFIFRSDFSKSIIHVQQGFGRRLKQRISRDSSGYQTCRPSSRGPNDMQHSFVIGFVKREIFLSASVAIFAIKRLIIPTIDKRSVGCQLRPSRIPCIYSRHQTCPTKVMHDTSHQRMFGMSKRPRILEMVQCLGLYIYGMLWLIDCVLWLQMSCWGDSTFRVLLEPQAWHRFSATCPYHGCSLSSNTPFSVQAAREDQQ